MVIKAPLFSGSSFIKHAFFSREGGVSQGIYTSLNGGLGSDDDPASIKENRRRMAAHLNIEADNLLSLYQVHSAEVIAVTEPWGAERPRADAMVTASPGIALGISTADCGPVLFADAHNRVVGAAHAGWKGAIGGVLEATIEEMEKLGATRDNIVAVLGPTISQRNYEVGAEFEARFREDDPENNQFFKPGNQESRFFFNLPKYIASRIARTGIKAFSDVDMCTYADEQRFFSYRRTCHRQEPDYGRQISAICLAK